MRYIKSHELSLFAWFFVCFTAEPYYIAQEGFEFVIEMDNLDEMSLGILLVFRYSGTSVGDSNSRNH